MATRPLHQSRAATHSTLSCPSGPSLSNGVNAPSEPCCPRTSWQTIAKPAATARSGSSAATGGLWPGRETGDVTLPAPEASRRHAAVRPADGGVEVEDLGSLNGTFVNDERLEGTRVISESATVRVGLTTLRVELAEAVEPATPDEPVAAPDVTAPRAI